MSPTKRDAIWPAIVCVKIRTEMMGFVVSRTMSTRST